MGVDALAVKVLNASVGDNFVYARQAIPYPALLQVAITLKYKDCRVLHNVVQTGHCAALSSINA